jgi:hypothetical protein
MIFIKFLLYRQYNKYVIESFQIISNEIIEPGVYADKLSKLNSLSRSNAIGQISNNSKTILFEKPLTNTFKILRNKIG